MQLTCKLDAHKLIRKMQFLLPSSIFGCANPPRHKLNAIEINFCMPRRRKHWPDSLTRHKQQVCSNCINLLATSSERAPNRTEKVYTGPMFSVASPNPTSPPPPPPPLFPPAVRAFRFASLAQFKVLIVA